ncbi:hypothetical protein [Cecembia sp.]|uniref:hypothetical protein n=1 Tax=Cecembia sp. TaxID=1898110 RepID=UPI0025C520A4|nr:hypothetical protein [Cecembia sp.]
MKKLALVLVSMIFLGACTQEKSVEERYVYEVDKVIDVETGDEYLMEDEGEITIVHTDGTTEKIAVEEAPFYESALSEDFLKSMEAKLQQRKLDLLEDKKNKIKEVRRSRYAHISDDDLLDQFQQAHKDRLDMSRQMDMVAELVERGVVSSDDAPGLLEISPEMIDFNIELEKPNEN